MTFDLLDNKIAVNINLWMYVFGTARNERHARKAVYYLSPTMRKLHARAWAPGRPEVYLVFSFILLQASLQGDPPLGPGTLVAGVHRATRRAIRDDASYAIGAGDWPCANLAYHSLMHSGGYSTLLSQRTLPKQRGYEEIYDRNATRRQCTRRGGGERIAKHTRM